MLQYKDNMNVQAINIYLAENNFVKFQNLQLVTKVNVP